MKKKNLLLTFLLAALVFGGVMAQTTVTIGTGTAGSYWMPFTMFPRYFFGETIYTSAQIAQNENKTITRISYYYLGNNNFNGDEFGVDIYMKNSDKSSFTGNTDWVLMSSDDMVYSGTVTLPNTAGWVTIVLNTEFEYDYTKNLIVAINRTTNNGDGSYSAGNAFNTTTGLSNYQTLYYSNSSSPFDPSTISIQGSRYQSLSNIQITFKDESSFSIPTGLTASPIKTYSATLTWDETENATSYNVKYHEASSTEWTTETGLATNTLALSNLIANTAYEAQVQAVYSGGDSEWSTSYNFTTLPLKENKYDGTGWASAWNWEPSGVPTENHDVLISKNMPIDGNAAANNITIATGKTMTIQNGYSLTCNSITNNGSLIIEEGGQLICNYSTTATIKKGITAATNWGNETTYTPDGWYFIASPIDLGTGIAPGSVTNLLQGDYDLYRFNQAGANGEWENYKAHQNDNINPFKLYNKYGYLYANKNDVTLEFTGSTKPALNADSVLLIYNNQAGENMRGWNLVGNPFVFNAYANKPYYKINNDKDGVELVSAYNTNPIAPCTGIMVQATGAEQYVKFTKEAPAAPSKGGIELNLTGNGKRGTETLDKAIVSFNEGSELGKFYFGTPEANIYIPQNGKEFAIVSAEAQGEMPVCFKAAKDGQYTITVNAENVEMGYLHLIDNITGADIDLLATPSYTFNAKSDDYASRFRLVFSGSSIEESVNEEQPFAFISNGEIVINGTGTVQAFDMLGRQLFSHKVDSASSIPNSEFPAAGIYVLQLTNNENTRTQKIVIR